MLSLCIVAQSHSPGWEHILTSGPCLQALAVSPALSFCQRMKIIKPIIFPVNQSCVNIMSMSTPITQTELKRVGLCSWMGGGDSLHYTSTLSASHESHFSISGNET